MKRLEMKHLKGIKTVNVYDCSKVKVKKVTEGKTDVKEIKKEKGKEKKKEEKKKKDVFSWRRCALNGFTEKSFCRRPVS